MSSKTAGRKLRKNRSIGEPIKADAIRTLFPFVIPGYDHYFIWVKVPSNANRRRLCLFTGLRQNGTSALVVRKVTKEDAAKLAKACALRVPEWATLFGEGMKVFLATNQNVSVMGLGTDRSPQMEYCGSLGNEC